MRQHASAGYTLIELLVVVAILSIVAVIAVPVTHRVTEAGADVVLDDVVHALRFARDEARRTREQRMISCDPVSGTITVGAVDSDKDTSYPSARTILRPGSDRPYVVAPAAASAGSAMDLVSCSFIFSDNTTTGTVVFDASGNPVRGIGKGPVREKSLRSGTIVLGAAHVRRTVHLALTGRITQS